MWATQRGVRCPAGPGSLRHARGSQPESECAASGDVGAGGGLAFLGARYGPFHPTRHGPTSPTKARAGRALRLRLSEVA